MFCGLLYHGQYSVCIWEKVYIAVVRWYVLKMSMSSSWFFSVAQVFYLAVNIPSCSVYWWKWALEYPSIIVELCTYLNSVIFSLYILGLCYYMHIHLSLKMCLFFSSIMFELKSILSVVNTATAAFLWLLFALYIFFYIERVSVVCSEPEKNFIRCLFPNFFFW